MKPFASLRHIVPVSLAAVGLFGGCLSSSHAIPMSDLNKMAQQAPETRGKKVRVIQAFAGSDSPPPARHAHNTTTVVVVGGHDHHHHEGRHRHGSSGGSVGSSGPGPSTGAKAKKDDAKVWLVLAGLVAITAAATEGARYDGWVELHPNHPVHLYGPRGQYRWVPLAKLDPQTAAWARKAFVRPSEGPWKELGRAPLNRVGWTYSMLLGQGQIPSGQEKAAGVATNPDSVAPGFLGHIQLGNFPNQELGILLDFGLGFRTNSFGNTVYEGRNALELQLWPVASGIFHAGGYGQLGMALRSEDGPKSNLERRTLVAGAGVQAQLEITTRLAITGRAGYLRIFGEDTAEATIGVSIY